MKKAIIFFLLLFIIHNLFSQVEKNKFHIIAGSYSDKNNALRKANDMKNHGYNAIVVKSTNEKYFRVSIAQLSIRSKAIEMLDQIVAKGGIFSTAWIDGAAKPVSQTKTTTSVKKLDNTQTTEVAYSKVYKNQSLLKAIRKNDMQTIKKLINQDADINYQDEAGLAPLIVAVFYNYYEIAKLLIMHDANVNVQDNEGFTPLIASIYRNNLEMCKLLVNNSADINLKNSSGFCAFDFAKALGNTEIISYLSPQALVSSAPPTPNFMEWQEQYNKMKEFYNSGNYLKAIEYGIKTVEISQKQFGKKDTIYVWSLNNLAFLYEITNKLEKAEILFSEAVSIKKEIIGENNITYINDLNNAGSLNLLTGNTKKAETMFVEANKNINLLIKQNFNYFSDTEKNLFISAANYSLDMFNSFLLKRKEENKSLINYCFNNELLKKSVILHTEQIPKLTNTDLYETQANLTKIKTQLSKYSLFPDADQKMIMEDALEEAKELEEILINNSDEFNNYYKSINTTWRDIKNNLKQNEAAIEFIHFDFYEKDWTNSTYYCALIIRHDYKNPEMVYLFEERELATLSKKIRKSNLSTNYSLAKANDGNALFQLIWQPFEQLLDGVKTIYYAKSGVLKKISFLELYNSDNTKLANKYRLINLSSTKKILIPQ
jgi:hypothetical protein